LGAATAAAPDKIGLETDDGITAARLSALDALKQERVFHPAAIMFVGQLEEGGDRRLHVGDQAGIEKLRAAGRMAGRKAVERWLDHGLTALGVLIARFRSSG